ncbi:MAG: hypothetical protein L0H73_05990 [Nitrococcus sp.]|nr:hypothetical protein [Nitrococcus sp.]
MRYFAMLIVLMFTLGFGGQVLADDDTAMGSQAYMEEEEFAAFETDDLATDDYGVYDEDFIWETDEDWYGDWYGDSSDYWEDYEYWGYDDAGEAGWFDW